MKSIAIMLGFTWLLVSASLVACKAPPTKQKKSAGSEGGGGSCTKKDSTNGKLMCQESDDSSFIPQLCSGTWSSEKCDAASYAIRCKSKEKVSVDNGPERSVTYITFHQKGTQYACTEASEEDIAEIRADSNKGERGDNDSKGGSPIGLKIETMDSKKLEAAIASLKEPSFSLEDPIVWGGKMSAKAEDKLQTFQGKFTDAQMLSVVAVGLVTTSECDHAVAMALRYKVEADGFDAWQYGPFAIEDNYVTPDTSAGADSTKYGSGKSGRISITASSNGGDGDDDDRKILSKTCAFITSFRVIVNKPSEVLDEDDSEFELRSSPAK